MLTIDTARVILKSGIDLLQGRKGGQMSIQRAWLSLSGYRMVRQAGKVVRYALVMPVFGVLFFVGFSIIFYFTSLIFWRFGIHAPFEFFETVMKHVDVTKP